jgi:hypothetical protein
MQQAIKQQQAKHACQASHNTLRSQAHTPRHMHTAAQWAHPVSLSTHTEYLLPPDYSRSHSSPQP